MRRVRGPSPWVGCLAKADGVIQREVGGKDGALCGVTIERAQLRERLLVVDALGDAAQAELFGEA